MPRNNPDQKYKHWLRCRLNRIATGEWGCTVPTESAEKFGGLETTIHLVCRPRLDQELRGTKLWWKAFVTIGTCKFESRERRSESGARDDVECQLMDVASSVTHFLGLGTENAE